MGLLTVTTYITVLVFTAAGRDYTLCRDTSVVSELEGEISGPTINDITASFEPVSCTLKINNISAGSWVGIFNMGTFINGYAPQTGLHCSEQAAYLSIYHPKTGSRDFCKPDRGVILTAYSALPAHLQFDLTSTRDGYQYQAGKVAFDLTYRVARSVHTGVNHVTEEKAKSVGSIVSHSTYPGGYISGIDSTLTLTGLKLAATVDIVFFKLDFHSNCQDYLEIKGLRSSDLAKNQICSDIERLKRWTMFQTTSTSISFHFVTANQNGGQGFRFNYRVNDDTGCPEVQIPNSRFEANLADTTGKVFTVTCDEGLHFSSISRQSVQVSCENNSMWMVSTDCKDVCDDNDSECTQSCKDNYRIDRLQCICKNEENLSEDGVTCKTHLTTTTVATLAKPGRQKVTKSAYVGIGVAAGLIFIIIILLVVLIIFRRRKRLAREGSVDKDYSDPSGEKHSPPLISDSSPDGRQVYHVLDHSEASAVYHLTQPMTSQYADPQVPSSRYANPANRVSQRDSADNEEANPYFNVPITELKSDEVVMEVNDLYDFT